MTRLGIAVDPLWVRNILIPSQGWVTLDVGAGSTLEADPHSLNESILLVVFLS